MLHALRRLPSVAAPACSRAQIGCSRGLHIDAFLTSSAASRVPLAYDSNAVRRCHNGRAVVFLHGLLGSGTNFRSIITQAALLQAADRSGIPHMLTVDLPGHGRNGPDGGVLAYDIEALASRVGDALYSAGYSDVTLVGHSLGGKVACHLALDVCCPLAVERLIVMDMAPVDYALSHPQWAAVAAVVAAAHACDPARHTTRAAMDACMAATVPDAGMRSFVLQNLALRHRADGHGSEYEWRVDLYALRASLPAFAAFPLPVVTRSCDALPAWFIHGGNSNFVQPHMHARIKQLYGRARFHAVEGAGHWLHADDPAATTAALARAIDGTL